MPHVLLVGRNARKLQAISQEYGGLPLDHRSWSSAALIRVLDLLRCADDRSPGGLRQAGDRRRETRLLREADCDERERRAGVVSSGRSCRREARRGAGQVVAARDAQTEDACEISASSGESCRCAASSATGCSKAIPFRRSARHGTTGKEDGGGIIIDMLCHWRYVLDNLFGDSEGRLLPGRDPHPGTPRRSRQSLSTARLTIPPTPRSNWRAASSRISTLPGPSGCAATICLRCRWMAPRAPPWPVCAIAGSSLTGRLRGRSGIRISRIRSTSSNGWQKVPEQEPFDNAFKRNGSCSCGTL